MSHDDTETASIEHWHRMWLQQCELTRKAQDRCSRLVAMGDELREENKKLQGQIRFLNRVVNTCAREHEECQLPSVMATSAYPFKNGVTLEEEIMDIVKNNRALIRCQIIEAILEQDSLPFHGVETGDALDSLIAKGRLVIGPNSRHFLGDDE